MVRTKLLIAVALALTIPDAPSFAQKAKDIVRVAVTEPMKRLDSYYFAVQDANFFTQSIHAMLIRYDEGTATFVPEIAKSWKRTDDQTIEFELDERARFSDGSPLGADDVVHMFNWRIDPNLRIAFATRFAWGERAEKIGPRSVRIHAKRVTSADLINLAYQLPIYSAAIHSKLTDKSEYGLNPIGAGPVKLARFDANDGILVEANKDYRLGPPANFRQLLGVPIPDRQTQVAHLMAGAIEALKAESKDQFDEMSKVPGFYGFSRDKFTLLYVTMDARGRSEQKALLDPRVRRAIFMAINRKAIADNLIAGNARTINALCFPGMVACPTMGEPFPYDPDGAKKLLAEAGYPNGIDLELATRDQSRQAGIVIAGDLRKVGIRATVNHMTVGAFRKYRDDGKVQVMVGDTPVGSVPDTSNSMRQQYGSQGRDFAEDELLNQWLEEAEATHDVERRRTIYANMYARIYEQAYSYPLTTWPETWIVKADTEIRPGTWNDSSVQVHDFGWK